LAQAAAAEEQRRAEEARLAEEKRRADEEAQRKAAEEALRNRTNDIAPGVNQFNALMQQGLASTREQNAEQDRANSMLASYNTGNLRGQNATSRQQALDRSITKAVEAGFTPQEAVQMVQDRELAYENNTSAGQLGRDAASLLMGQEWLNAENEKAKQLNRDRMAGSEFWTTSGLGARLSGDTNDNWDAYFSDYLNSAISARDDQGGAIRDFRTGARTADDQIKAAAAVAGETMRGIGQSSPLFGDQLGWLLGGGAETIVGLPSMVTSGVSAFGDSLSNNTIQLNPATGQYENVAQGQQQANQQLMSSVLDFAGAGKAANVGLKAAGSTAKRVGQAAVKGAAVEAPVEVAQTSLEASVNGENATVEQLQNAAAGGVVFGGALGGVAAVPSGVGARKAPALDSSNTGIDLSSVDSDIDASALKGQPVVATGTPSAPSQLFAQGTQGLPTQQAATPNTELMQSAQAVPSPANELFAQGTQRLMQELDPLRSQVTEQGAISTSPITENVAPMTSPDVGVVPRVAQQPVAQSIPAAQQATVAENATVEPVSQEAAPVPNATTQAQVDAPPEQTSGTTRTSIQPSAQTNGELTTGQRNSVSKAVKNATRQLNNDLVRDVSAREATSEATLQKAFGRLADATNTPREVSDRWAQLISNDLQQGKTFKNADAILERIGFERPSGGAVEAAARTELGQESSLETVPKKSAEKPSETVARASEAASKTKKKSGGTNTQKTAKKPTTKADASTSGKKMGRGETGERKQGRNSRYDVASVAQAKMDVDTFFERNGEKEFREFIKEASAKTRGYEINIAQYKRILEVAEENGIKLSARQKSELKSNADFYDSISASNLALRRWSKNEAVYNGTATGAELKAYIENSVGEELSAEAQTEADAIADSYEKAKDVRDSAQKKLQSAMNAKDDAAVKKTLEDFERAQRELTATTRLSDACALNEINRDPDEGNRKRRTHAWIKERGIYFQDWIDASLLSSISGRVFDQLNGYMSLLEQLSPGTYAIDKALMASFNTQAKVDARGGQELTLGTGMDYNAAGKGASVGYKKALENYRMRKGMDNVGTGAWIRNLVTTAVEFGDAPIDAGGMALTVNHYKGAGYSQQQATAMAMFDRYGVGKTDGVFKAFKDAVALEQGLGSRNYGASWWLKKTVNKALDKVAALDDHPYAKENISKMFDRSLLGFWDVTKKMGLRGLSRSTLGIPKILYALRTTEPSSLQRAQAIRRGLLDMKSGGMLLGVGFYLGMEGIITGGYPDDPDERAYWERMGIQPNSVKIGDFYWEVPRLFGTFGMPLLMGASIGRNMKEGIPLEDGINNSIKALWEGFTDAAGIANIANNLKVTSQAMEGDLMNSATKNLVASMIGMWIPASSLVNFSANAFDPVKRDTYDSDWAVSVGKALINKIPFVRGSYLNEGFLNPKVDWAGDMVKNTNPFARMFGANGMAQGHDSPIDLELKRLMETGNGVIPSNKNVEMKLADGSVAALNDKQQLQLNETVRMERFVQLNDLIGTTIYQEADDATKSELISKAYKFNDSSIMTRLAKEWGLGEVKIDSATINADIPQEYGMALREYELRSAEDRAIWLQDKKNASDYYNALFENKRLNGTLTEDDQNMSQNSLAYKAAISSYNYENDIDSAIISKYDSENNDTVGRLFTSNPDMARKLIMYDAVLAEAGLSGKTGQRDTMKFSSVANKYLEKDVELADLYWTMKYETAERNGTLSYDDQDLQYGTASGLLYRMTEARFNHENNIDPWLSEKYKSISVTEWRKLADTDPDLYQKLYALDQARTAQGISRKDANHNVPKYTLTSSGSGGGRGGGGGGSGAGWSLSAIPSVADLSRTLFSPEGTKTSTTTSVKGNDSALSAALIDLKPNKTVDAGKGIKTKPTGFNAGKTVKYTASKIRQPNMGDTYMAFLKGKSVQDSFKASRVY
jgi:hypothetical protein